MICIVVSFLPTQRHHRIENEYPVWSVSAYNQQAHWASLLNRLLEHRNTHLLLYSKFCVDFLFGCIDWLGPSNFLFFVSDEDKSYVSRVKIVGNSNPKVDPEQLFLWSDFLNYEKKTTTKTKSSGYNSCFCEQNKTADKAAFFNQKQIILY